MSVKPDHESEKARMLRESGVRYETDEDTRAIEKLLHSEALRVFGQTPVAVNGNVQYYKLCNK